MFRRIAIGSVLAAAAFVSLAPVAAAAPPTGAFALTHAKVGGGAKHAGFATIFTGFEITGGPAGTGIALAAQKEFPVDIGLKGYKTSSATGTFSMTASVDPATGKAAGTFAYAQTSTTTWDVTQTYRGETTILGSSEMKAKSTWRGDVAGSVGADTADLTFSGAFVTNCSLKIIDVTSDCSSNTSYGVPVTFTVTGGTETAVPGKPATDRLGVTQDIAGDVYISPASEADLEPGARHFQLVKPGQKLALEAGTMLRTGRDGTVAILGSTGTLTRLGPSTLFGMKKFERVKPSQWVMYGRLFDGIAFFYMAKWKESGKKFEVETDRAILTIKGTTFEVAVTPAATVVTVAEGVVAVTDKATGTVIDVGPGERVTVDASGMTKAATPAASAGPGSTAPPAAASPGGSATPPPATSMASPAATASTAAGPASPQALAATAPPSAAPASSGQAATAPPLSSPAPAAVSDPAPTSAGSDGSGAPIGLLAAGLAGIGVVLVVAVGMRRRGPRR